MRLTGHGSKYYHLKTWKREVAADWVGIKMFFSTVFVTLFWNDIPNCTTQTQFYGQLWDLWVILIKKLDVATLVNTKILRSDNCTEVKWSTWLTGVDVSMFVHCFVKLIVVMDMTCYSENSFDLQEIPFLGSYILGQNGRNIISPAFLYRIHIWKEFRFH